MGRTAPCPHPEPRAPFPVALRSPPFLSPLIFLRQGWLAWTGTEPQLEPATGQRAVWVRGPPNEVLGLHVPSLPARVGPVTVGQDRGQQPPRGSPERDPISSHSQGRNAGSGPGIQMCARKPSPRPHLSRPLRPCFLSLLPVSGEQRGPGPRLRAPQGRSG